MYYNASVDLSYAFFFLSYYIISGDVFWSWTQKEAQANFHGSNKVAIIIITVIYIIENASMTGNELWTKRIFTQDNTLEKF